MDINIKIEVLFDNYCLDSHLKPGWGYSALVTTLAETILFDTGADGKILMSNMQAMGVDKDKLGKVFISHYHDDHMGGLMALLETGIKPVVYLLARFPQKMIDQIKALTTVVEACEGQSLGEGFFSTGDMGGNMPEHSLLYENMGFLVLLTGCAHPGLARILEKAKSMKDLPLSLVMGGFHYKDKNSEELPAIVDELIQMNIQKIAPSHCTGDLAISALREKFGDGFVNSGAGQIISIDRSGKLWAKY